MLSWAQYEALVETLDILGDEEQTAHLRRAVAEIEAGGGSGVGGERGNPNDLPHRAGAGCSRALSGLLNRQLRAALEHRIEALRQDPAEQGLALTL